MQHKWRKFRNSILLLCGGIFLVTFFLNCSNSNFKTIESFQGPSSISGLPLEPGADSSNDPAQQPAPIPQPLPNPNPVPQPVPAGGTITDLKIENTGSTEQVSVPVTFAQVFAPGHVSSADLIAGKLSDGTVLPLQVDAKAKHPDGSIRHAVISAVLPKLAVGQIQTLSLTKASGSTGASALTPNDLVNAGFVATVKVSLGGVLYSASADQLLKSGSPQAWLAGPIANEWLLSAPLKTSAGMAHPHLTARFAIRAYAGQSRAKVDVVLENNWAYEPAPQNFVYDLQISVGGQTVYSKTALKHFTHARWRKSFWWGSTPQIHIRHNTGYLIASRAVPNYDQSIPISEAALASMQASWTGDKIEPMGPGVAVAYMPTTGGRQDIGLNPAWGAAYLLSMDKRAKEVALGMGNLAGSWPMHMRDKNTDRPMSVYDYPYSTIAGRPGDTINPATNKSESFPDCGGDCAQANTADSSHQPNLAYIPYLLTGEFYYLEEILFWAAYNVFQHNPYYREFSKGLVKPSDVRGQAWSLRSLGDAAYITPDNHPMKTQFVTILNNNLDWYNSNYSQNPNANIFGVIIEQAVIYNGGLGLAPWQDDFFTQSIGQLAERGFDKAKPLLAWKSKFTVGRMIAPGFCWIFAGVYSLNIRSSSTSPFYNSFAEAFDASKPPEITTQACGSAEMGAALKLAAGEMVGYSESSTGYPSNYQPALAYSADSGVAGAAQAWQKFMSRSVKPVDYSSSPQFSIVPRQ
jgi:hypothetical protein